jgi:hypothetical protein
LNFYWLDPCEKCLFFLKRNWKRNFSFFGTFPQSTCHHQNFNFQKSSVKNCRRGIKAILVLMHNHVRLFFIILFFSVEFMSFPLIIFYFISASNKSHFTLENLSHYANCIIPFLSTKFYSFETRDNSEINFLSAWRLLTNWIKNKNIPSSFHIKKYTKFFLSNTCCRTFRGECVHGLWQKKMKERYFSEKLSSY